MYVHGLFENTVFRQRFLERLGWQGQAVEWSAALEAELDRVAGLVSATGLAGHLREIRDNAS